jgi:hypothetical protein
VKKKKYAAIAGGEGKTLYNFLEVFFFFDSPPRISWVF